MDQTTSTSEGSETSPVSKSLEDLTRERDEQLRQARAQRFKFLPGSEFLKRYAGELTFLIDKVLEKTAVTMFFGDTGSGKTALFLLMAVCLAAGVAFPGTPEASPPKKVLFVGQDSGQRKYRQHIDRILRGLDIPFPENLLIYDVDSHRIDLYKTNDAGEFRRAIFESGFEVVLVDSLNASSTAKEIDNTEMGVVMEWFTALSERCTVALIHHTGKGGKLDPRGGAVILNRADHAWGVTLKGHEMTLTLEKSRSDLERGTRVGYRYAWDTDAITFEPGIASSGMLPESDGPAPLAHGAREHVNGDTVDVAVESFIGTGGASGRKVAEIVNYTMPIFGENMSETARRSQINRSLARLKAAGVISQDFRGGPYVLAAKSAEGGKSIA